MPTKQPRLALVIDSHSKAQIKHLAEMHGRSTSAEIVTAVHAWLDQHPNEMQRYEQPTPTPEQEAQIEELAKAAERAAYAHVMYNK